MPKFNEITVIFLLLASVAAGTGVSPPSIEAATLWQFGQHRLLGGASTLPLLPLGTVFDVDGSATTYRYEVSNPTQVTLTDAAGGFTVQTNAVPTPRTIVASASGWVELFDNNREIACSFVNSEFGACMDTIVGGIGSTANSGVPTPVVLQVALTASPLTTAPTLTSQTVPPTLTSPPVPTSTPNQKSSPPPVGAIVGSVLGVLAVLLICAALFTVIRRRRLRRIEPDNSGIPPISFDTAPQVEAAATAWTGASGPPRNHGAAKWRQEAVRRQYIPDADETTDSASSPQPSEPSMTEILDRLRRLETEGSSRNDPPPPSYMKR